MARKETDDTDVGLATLPPTSRQTWSAIAVAAILLAGLAAVAPFADTPLFRTDSFIPMVDAIMFVTDLITSILLFSQFSIYRSWALLALASGYLFTALMIVPHALTFPGAFSPTGLLGAGLQTTSALYWFWHLAFPLALLAYGWLKRAGYIVLDSTLLPVGLSAMGVLALVCGLTLLATAGEKYLPRLVVDRIHTTSLNSSLGAPVVLICATAIAVLWTGRRSVLDQWLMVVAVAAISETVLTSLLVTARYSLGFYVARGAALITSTAVLVVLLAETTRLYARLVHSNIMLRRAEDNKLMNFHAITSGIAHEVKQPLTAILANSDAALILLEAPTPDHAEIREALNDIANDTRHTVQALDGFRTLFKNVDEGRQMVDINSIVLEVLQSLHGELREHGIEENLELTTELPLIDGNRNQLQQVLFNLVHNAVEAMQATTNRHRLLRLTTEQLPDTIALTVQDSGPGIDPKQVDSIFEAFVTTKKRGMGLGLAICRMITERHGGQLTVSSDGKSGALFQLILPIKSPGRTHIARA